jgi:hypothetical protein
VSTGRETSFSDLELWRAQRYSAEVVYAFRSTQHVHDAYCDMIRQLF